MPVGTVSSPTGTGRTLFWLTIYHGSSIFLEAIRKRLIGFSGDTAVIGIAAQYEIVSG